MEPKQAVLDLSVIKKYSEDSRNMLLNNGWHYILWGVVVSAALVANYIMLPVGVRNKYAGLKWFVLILFAGIILNRKYKGGTAVLRA